MSFFENIKRRKVLQVAAVYLVVSWLIVQVVDVVGPALSLPDRALTFVIVSLAVGFPIALVLSWFFAITPDGVQLESKIDPVIQKNRDRVALIVIAMLAAGLFVSLLNRDPTWQPAGEPSLAILPLTNISSDPDDDPFVTGLHEDLLTQMSRISSIKVISRASVLRYSGTDLPISTIASQLDVVSIIAGSVQKLGERLRVQIQLIDGKSEQYLWSESFDRNLTASDIFAIQREIATAVAGALKAKLTGADRQRLQKPATQDLGAYSAYMLGKQKIEKRTSQALDEAIEHLRRAITIDPGFAAAHAQLAMAYDLASWYGDLSREGMLTLAMPAAQRAIDLDPTLAEGWTALADLRSMSGDASGAETAFQKAIELNPNYPVALHWYALLALDRGDYEAALGLHRRALALDPLSVTLMNNVAQDLLYLDRATEALAQYERSLELDPNFAPTHAHMANIYASAFGRPDEAFRWLLSAAQLDDRHTEYPSQLAMLLVDLDDPDNASGWAEQALKLGPRRYWPNAAMLSVSHRKSDEQAMSLYAGNVLANSPQNWHALHVLRNLDIRAGQLASARARYAETTPELFQQPPEVDATNYARAIDLAYVVREMGDVDTANDLLQRAAGIVNGRSRTGPSGILFADIEILAMQGDIDAALGALEQSADSDWISLWWHAATNPNFSNLHQNARFDAALNRIRSRAAGYRANIGTELRRGS